MSEPTIIEKLLAEETYAECAHFALTRLVNPDGPEAAEKMKALVEALEGARSFLADRAAAEGEYELLAEIDTALRNIGAP